jgi:hypothetical protein
LPSQQEHMQKAAGNAAFALSIPLTDQTRIDWALVILFYAAVHYIEAYLASSGQHLKNHTTRDSMVGRDSSLRPVFADYQDLKFYGFNARYEVSGFSAHDITDVASKACARIESHIKSIL